ncbi:MAG: hypothetical protein H6Q54_1815 [Deltaproteobacteria bacterium]|nr:hypothetical protein [Deltaproteobacteria bacterium]
MTKNYRLSGLNMFFITCACIAGLLLVAGFSYSQEFQKVPIMLKASDTLPQQWLKGPNYTIKEKVTNDGVVSTYELNTNYGPVVVETTVLLLKRIHELKAIHKMEQLQGTDVFANAAKGAATGPLTTAKGLVEDPAGTVSAIGSGIGKFFGRVSDSMESSDPYQAGVTQSALGQASSKRAFAYEFGVDPYSPYPPLQKLLDSIAWTAASGSLTVKAAFSAIPGGAGAVVSLTGTADSLRSLVRDKTPAELQAVNATRLKAIGVPDSLAKVFLNNYSYDPWESTLLVGELANMKDVKDPYKFIVAACVAQSEPMAVFMRVMAQIMVLYRDKRKSVERFVEADNLPLLQKKDGTVVAVLPLDHLAWTQRFANKEKAVSEAIKKIPRAKGKEFVIVGSMDPTARKALQARGWKVEEKFAEATFRETVGKSMTQ